MNRNDIMNLNLGLPAKEEHLVKLELIADMENQWSEQSDLEIQEQEDAYEDNLAGYESNMDYERF